MYHLGHMCLRLPTAGPKQLKAHIRILWSLSSGLELRLTHPFPPIFLAKGTVYEKTDAQVEMKKINREEFWEQAKVGVERREVSVSPI